MALFLEEIKVIVFVNGGGGQGRIRGTNEINDTFSGVIDDKDAPALVMGQDVLYTAVTIDTGHKHGAANQIEIPTVGGRNGQRFPVAEGIG